MTDVWPHTKARFIHVLHANAKCMFKSDRIRNEYSLQFSSAKLTCEYCCERIVVTSNMLRIPKKHEPVSTRVDNARWTLPSHIFHSPLNNPASLALQYAVDGSTCLRSHVGRPQTNGFNYGGLTLSAMVTTFDCPLYLSLSAQMVTSFYLSPKLDLSQLSTIPGLSA